MNYYPMQNCKRGAMKGRSRKQKKEDLPYPFDRETEGVRFY